MSDRPARVAASRRRAPAPIALVLALALGGCGSGVIVQDDFYVQRSGNVPAPR